MSKFSDSLGLVSVVAVIGTCDTKHCELSFVKNMINEFPGRVSAILVDISLTNNHKSLDVDVSAQELLSRLPEQKQLFWQVIHLET